MRKIALITGITGQDGAYLTNLLLSKNYIVHGIKRRTSIINTTRVDPFYKHPQAAESFFLHYGDLTDALSTLKLIKEIQPDEIYHLGAQSHVGVSFECPVYTADVDALGTLRILESIKILELQNKVKFYQASTSEMYGKVQTVPQSEKTPFYPRSPYGVSKVFSYWTTVNYREMLNMFAVNGILFNHESPLRGETFVTRKITMAVAKIKLGTQKKLWIGNLDAERDWGHSKDYMVGMWKMLQAEKPEDYVLATGIKTSVRDFIKMTFKAAEIDIEFKGEGKSAVGYNKENGEILVQIDPRYFRPVEVDQLIGDPSKAKAKLNWETKIGLEELCNEMYHADLYREIRSKMYANDFPDVEHIIHSKENVLNWSRKIQSKYFKELSKAS